MAWGMNYGAAIMLKLFVFSTLSLATLTALTAPGCDSAIDRAYDCDQICDKYKECADSNYDDGACAERCRENAADSESYEDQADVCQACIDDESCAGAAFNCASECIGIVP